MGGEMKDWAHQLGLAIKALETADFPPNSICHHLGIAAPIAGPIASVELVPAPSRTGGLLIMLYTRKAKNFPRHVFDEYRKGCAEYGEILDEWNGQEGHSGISIVIDREVPEKFSNALRNYINMRDVFNPTDAQQRGFAAFDRVWKEALISVGLLTKQGEPIEREHVKESAMGSYTKVREISACVHDWEPRHAILFGYMEVNAQCAKCRTWRH
jgi:hypothetical protein